MSGDLIEFLRARLDEDEQTARAASPGPWRHNPEKHHHIVGTPLFEEAVFAGPTGADATCVAGTGETDDSQSMRDAAHIARHDPARVLREVEAKRALVAAYELACRKRTEIADEHWGAAPSGDLSAVERWKEHDAVAEALKPHVLRRAAVYVDHPDYRAEWRP
ncbi:DUF6221 family protein [Streptomyces smyrnaeus]|uniref:DUF6221 family protein n=1 Tax=Streptomyces smyrnaeus TaxID=1387713 RepID=UPI0036C0BB34